MHLVDLPSAHRYSQSQAFLSIQTLVFPTWYLPKLKYHVNGCLLYLVNKQAFICALKDKANISSGLTIFANWREPSRTALYNRSGFWVASLYLKISFIFPITLFTNSPSAENKLPDPMFKSCATKYFISLILIYFVRYINLLILYYFIFRLPRDRNCNRSPNLYAPFQSDWQCGT